MSEASRHTPEAGVIHRTLPGSNHIAQRLHAYGALSDDDHARQRVPHPGYHASAAACHARAG